MVFALLQLIFLIGSPLIFIALGRVTFDLMVAGLSALWGPRWRRSSEWEQVLPFFVFGLLAYLIMVFILRALHLPWLAASLLPCAAAYGGFARLGDLLQTAKKSMSVNFVLWFAVVFALGLSLFNVTIDGIVTPWVNNYGDLTFHLGMITSFVFGGNIPPEYHLYPGETLSYPFLMNLWSAAYWAVYPAFRSLVIVFAFQWLVVWIAAYFALNGNRFKLAPWALLFGGGTYDYIFNCLTVDPRTQACIDGAHVLIGHGYPWTPFITTIWVTQRPTLIGILVVLVALQLFHAWLKNEGHENDKLFFSGLLLGLAPLTHFHFFFAASLYIILVLAIRAFPAFLKQSWSELRERFRRLMSFCLPLCLVAASLPWLIGKASITKITAGWMPWPNQPGPSASSDLLRAVSMWLNNAPAWLLMLIVVFLLSKRRAPAIAFLILFLFGNFVQLAIWEWDQLKFFLALYFISLCFLQTFETDQFRPLISSFLLLLILPGLYETFEVMRDFKNHTVYSRQEMSMADSIKRTVEPEAIIAAKPDHNSLVTLTGRRLFAGYDGTLSSHGIDYQARYNLEKNLDRVVHCRSESSSRSAICPDYVLWTDREKGYWLREALDYPRLLTPAVDGFLYKVEMEAERGR